jgi:hypothetical protein
MKKQTAEAPKPLENAKTLTKAPPWMTREERREQEQQQLETPAFLQEAEQDRRKRYSNPPVGMWGLTFDIKNKGDRKLMISRQFYVLGRVSGTDYFLVRFYEWLTGGESDDSLRPLAWFLDGEAEFFDTPAQMRYRTEQLRPIMDAICKQEFEERTKEAGLSDEPDDTPLVS